MTPSSLLYLPNKSARSGARWQDSRLCCLSTAINLYIYIHIIIYHISPSELHHCLIAVVAARCQDKKLKKKEKQAREDL